MMFIILSVSDHFLSNIIMNEEHPSIKNRFENNTGVKLGVYLLYYNSDLIIKN